MNNQRVQTLEALLTRIKKNAGEPRPERARARAEAPVGAETRAAAPAKPVAEARTVPPQAAAPKEPPKAASAPIAAPAEPRRAAPAEVVPSHTGTPKVTPRLIDPVTSADQDPAKWTLDDMGTGEPSPKPSPVAAAQAKTPPAKAPVEAKRPEPMQVPEARPSPRTGLGGLGGFGKQIEAKRQTEPKVEPPKAEPPKQVAPARVSDVEIDIDEPTHAEPPRGGVPSLSESADEEVEATVSGPIPTHILEMSRAAVKSEVKAAPPPEPALELPPPQAIEMKPMGGTLVVDTAPEPQAQPEPKKGLGHTMPMALDAGDDLLASAHGTLPMDPAPALVEIARAPEPAPARRPEPEPPVEPRPEAKVEPAIAPIEKLEPIASPPKVAEPAFSSGAANDSPSKFAQEPTDAAKSGGSWFGKTLLVAVVVVAAAAAVFVYIRRDEFFGTTKPGDSAPPATSQSAPTPTPTPSTPASTSPLSTPPASSEPSTSAAPATSGSAAPAADVGEPPGDPKQLGPTQGYIYVRTTYEGDVFAGNAKIGPVNKWIITPCPAFISVGKAIGQFVAPGKTAPVPCQGKLVYELP